MQYRTVTGYEDYEVFEDGAVLSYKHSEPHWLRPAPTSRGYLQVVLCRGGKRRSCFVHRLVAEAFVPNPENKPEVNHKDGNKLNNDAENLEWVTRGENYLHAHLTGLRPAAKLTPAQVAEIRRRLGEGEQQSELAKEFGVSQTQMSRIKNRTRWGEVA
jgi:hypothetical protein